MSSELLPTVRLFVESRLLEAAILGDDESTALVDNYPPVFHRYDRRRRCSIIPDRVVAELLNEQTRPFSADKSFEDRVRSLTKCPSVHREANADAVDVEDEDNYSYRNYDDNLNNDADNGDNFLYESRFERDFYLRHLSARGSYSSPVVRIVWIVRLISLPSKKICSNRQQHTSPSRLFVSRQRSTCTGCGCVCCCHRVCCCFCSCFGCCRCH